MIKTNIDFKKYLKDIILSNKNINKYYNINFPNSKYSLTDILDGILYILKTGIAWRDSKEVVKWQSLYFHFKRFVEHNIFQKLFLKLRSIFMSKNKTNIMNKFGKNHIARNKFFKNKNCNKISLITDVNGIPLSALVNTGNIHNISFLKDHVNDLIVLNKT